LDAQLLAIFHSFWRSHKSNNIAMSFSSLQDCAYFLDDGSIPDNLAHLGVPDLTIHRPILSHGFEPSAGSERPRCRPLTASRTVPGVVAYRYSPSINVRVQHPRSRRSQEIEALHPFVVQEEMSTEGTAICFVGQTLVTLKDAPHLQDVHWSRLPLSTAAAAGYPEDCVQASNSPVSCVIPPPQSTAVTSPSPPLTIQVMPGLHLTLHGAAETHLAIADGLYGPVQCLDCQCNLFCILKASLVLCPTCRAIGPSGMEHVEHGIGNYNEGGVDICGGGTESSVGLGFTLSDLLEYLSEA
jgi:hypothetical protein